MNAVDAAFAAMPRHWFLRPDSHEAAAIDAPIPIGFGQTNSQPRTVRDMLHLLAVEPGHRILDVGSGSGWTTALLAYLAGPTGTVVGVELEPDLVRFGRDNLAVAASEHGAALAPARIVEAGAVFGAPEHGPYDRILVSAEPARLPDELVEQLAPDGVMVIPVAGTMCRVRRTPDGTDVEHHGRYRFVPLRGR